MTRYAISRSLQYVLVLAVAVTINFMLPRIAPGTPVDYLLGDQAVQLNESQKRQLLAEFGLIVPIPDQFINYEGYSARRVEV